MEKQILSEQFLRMQKLAGIQPVNNENTLVLEGVKIFKNIFSSGLLTEAEVNIEEFDPKAIAFYKALGITYENLDAEGQKLLADLFKEAQKNPEEVKKQIQSLNLKEAEGEEENFQGGDSTIGKLRKYFEKNKVGKAIKNTILGLVISVITVPSIVNAAKLLSPKDVKATVKTINVDSKLNADTGNTAYFPAEDAKLNAEDVGVKLNDNSLIIPFKLAKGDSAGLKDPNILKNFIDTLKAKYSDPSISGKITIKLTGYASNDSGTSSDKSTTSDKPLSQERAETIKSQIPTKIGNVDIDVEIEQGDYNDLKKEDPNSNNHIKGAVLKVDIKDANLKQTKTTSEEVPTELMNVYQPVKADYDSEPRGNQGAEGGEGAEDSEPGTGGEGGTGGTGGPGGGIGGGGKSMSTDQVQKYLSYFPNLNRNGQLAVVLAAASPKTNIYNKLGLDQIKSFTDTELKNVTNPEAKKIADLILNLRKNPNTLINKLSSSTGIKLAPRAKAVQTAPGQKYQPSSQLQKTIAEVFSLVESLNEAMVDTIFDELGISDSELKNNRSSLLALVGSMYANAGDTTISILDPKDLTPEEQDKLKELGFSPQGAKGEYVFLQQGQTKKDINFDKKQSQIKDKPDVTKIDLFLEKQPLITQRLNKVNTEKELSGVIQLFINQMAEKQPEKFGSVIQQQQLIANLLNRLPSQSTVQSEAIAPSPELPDVANTKKTLSSNTTFNSLFKNINDIEEATQIILRVALGYVDPTLQNSARIRTSINMVKKSIEDAAKEAKKK